MIKELLLQRIMHKYYKYTITKQLLLGCYSNSTTVFAYNCRAHSSPPLITYAMRFKITIQPRAIFQNFEPFKVQ